MDDSNANPKQQLLEKLRSSTNILVTVSNNPSVDQLAACIGLTIWLNKLGKHGTAVFSGEVPSTLEFLQPEDTIEKNTNSLRDFIIALDKSKADKLRYKVEDRVVKIFITPYRTSLSADDLEFSQGDFNVDMVVAIGVSEQQDLDTAITAHGRILHDATVATINTTPENEGGLGSINWHDTQASSLSELVADLGNELDRTQLDGQIATALLTGIVAETKRFSNEKTTPQTMSVSAALMSAGANQQLVATKLEEPLTSVGQSHDQDDTADQPAADESEPPKSDDGTLEIEHQPGQGSEDEPDEEPEDEAAAGADEEPTDSTEAEGEDEADAADESDLPALETDPAEPRAETPLPTEPQASDVEETPEPAADDATSEEDDKTVPKVDNSKSSKLVTEPPTLGGTLTASSRPDDAPEPVTDPLSLPPVEADQPLLNREDDTVPTPPAPDVAPASAALPTPQPAPPSWMPPQSRTSSPSTLPSQSPVTPESPKTNDTETLAEIEQAVDSPHAEVETPSSLDTARNEVNKAISGAPQTNPEPIQALNAQPIDLAPSPQPAPPAENSLAFNPSAFNVMNDPDAQAATPPVAPTFPPLQQVAPSVPTATNNVPSPLPTLMPPPADPVPPTSSPVSNPTAPPPVPPPMMPPGFLPPAEAPSDKQ